MSSILKKVLFWTLIFSTSILLLFVTLISLFLLLSPSQRMNQISKYYTYQMTEVNPSSHTRTTGSFKSSQILDQEEFLSYFNEQTSSSIFVTNFGGSSYSCTGSCFCSDTKSSRRFPISTSTILTRSLLILVSAFSSTMAVQLAKEAFQNECEFRFSQDDCAPGDKVDYDVVYCSEEEKEAEEFAKNKILPGKYHCVGHCVERNVFQLNQFQYLDEKFFVEKKGTSDDKMELEKFFVDRYERIGKEKFGDCKSLKLEKAIDLDEEVFLRFRYLSVEEEQNYDIHFKDGLSLYFAEKVLSPFCETASAMKDDWLRGSLEEFKGQLEANVVDLDNFLLHFDDEYNAFLKVPFCWGTSMVPGWRGPHTFENDEPNAVEWSDVKNLENVECTFQGGFEKSEE